MAGIHRLPHGPHPLVGELQQGDDLGAERFAVFAGAPHGVAVHPGLDPRSRPVGRAGRPIPATPDAPAPEPETVPDLEPARRTVRAFAAAHFTIMPPDLG
ncbi:hypothetical protein POF50_013300 [Streptomyces sp. SL13]|uniref:Uncharacterized protein n=1 Tax=Streptantibioticus silvisoli TaxID=2705255 RepID=A0AA90GY34_9ACTN|nr:hypothetical protein [Streptantibioticus silvisoli]MDI5970308.1 hypothetical protein [Streptantibioticus silvisoli]